MTKVLPDETRSFFQTSLAELMPPAGVFDDITTDSESGYAEPRAALLCALGRTDLVDADLEITLVLFQYLRSAAMLLHMQWCVKVEGLAPLESPQQFNDYQALTHLAFNAGTHMRAVGSLLAQDPEELPLHTLMRAAREALARMLWLLESEPASSERLRRSVLTTEADYAEVLRQTVDRDERLRIAQRRAQWRQALTDLGVTFSRCDAPDLEHPKTYSHESQCKKVWFENGEDSYPSATKLFSMFYIDGVFSFQILSGVAHSHPTTIRSKISASDFEMDHESHSLHSMAGAILELGVSVLVLHNRNTRTPDTYAEAEYNALLLATWWLLILILRQAAERFPGIKEKLQSGFETR